ncbi:MAG: PAS domain-containing sensor histidine kinase [Nitrospiraceae bacterium]|nr:PAS domain-containing sensor histidine kinase [Nitrospiraceae bacterium]
MRSKLLKYSPLTIAGIYFIIGALWIAYSDLLVFTLVASSSDQHLYASLKGWFYVLSTAVLLFLLLRKIIKLSHKEGVKAEERFRVLAQHTSAGLFIHSDKFIFANKSMLELTGYDEADLKSMSMIDILSDEFRSAAEERCREVLNGSKLYCSDEMKIIRKDGLERWVNIYGAMVTYDNENVLLGTVHDITGSMAVRQSLIKSEERYRLLFENNPQPMWLYDVKTLAFLEVNESAVRRYGYSRQEFLGMTIKDIRPHEDIDRLVNNVQQVKGGIDEAGVWRHIKKDGTLIFVEVVSYAFDIGGRLVELVQANDITATIEAQEQLLRINTELEDKIRERTKELSEANERLMDMDRLKTLFVASMTHELRTPLNAVLGFSTLLNDGVYGNLSAEQQEALAKVLKGGQQLLDLVNDAIDVTKIEAGQLEQQISDFDIYDLLTEVSMKFENEAAKKGLQLNLSPLHKHIHSDRRRIFQALLNLIDNAIKFTDKGSITVSAAVLNEGGDDEKISISVEDTGTGIKAENMEELFVPFSKIGMTERRMSHGTGLGLYLTNKIVEEALHGSMSIQSEFGKGSCFTMVLPVRL